MIAQYSKLIDSLKRDLREQERQMHEVETRHMLAKSEAQKKVDEAQIRMDHCVEKLNQS